MKDKTQERPFAAFVGNGTLCRPWGLPDEGSRVREASGIPDAVRARLSGECQNGSRQPALLTERRWDTPVLQGTWWVPGVSTLPYPPVTRSPAPHSVWFPVLYLSKIKSLAAVVGMWFGGG